MIGTQVLWLLYLVFSEVTHDHSPYFLLLLPSGLSSLIISAKQATIKGAACHVPTRESWHIRLNTINSSTLIRFLSSFPNLASENPLLSCMMVTLEGILNDSAQGFGWWMSSGGLFFMIMRLKLARHYPFSHQPADDFPSGHCLRKCQRRESSSALERTNSSV